MASYNDIDSRLRVVEDKANFILQTQRVRINVGSPLDAAPRIVDCSLLDLYRMLKQTGAEVGEDSITARTADIIDAEVTEQATGAEVV